MAKTISPIRTYATFIGVLDFIVLIVTQAITYFACYHRLFLPDSIKGLFGGVTDTGTASYALAPHDVGLALLTAWLLALAIFGSRDIKIIGSDASEYRRVVTASLTVLGTLAFGALYFKVDVSRVYVSSIIFFGLLAILLERRIARAWLRNQRSKGRFRKRVALYGSTEDIEFELQKFNRIKEAEFEPVFVIQDSKQLKLRELSNNREESFELTDLPEVCKSRRVEVLQVIGSSSTSAHMHKRLYWALDGTDISFVVSPAITGVSSSKLTTRVIAGSPLLEISSTKFTGPQYIMKTLLDLVLGTVAFLVSLPIVFIAALIVKLEDKGPAFFTQTRVGLNGKEFTMYKIRSMKVGAELEHAERQKALSDVQTNVNMFKDPEDPRVTKVGRVIRKYSIDELPQFLNVLKGDMSLVGPRPPLLSEVEQWKQHETRRLLVKPGVTGPWQIGGRSLLTWEETVAIDLSYVENWTVLTDISIIFKTVVYVVKGSGAF
jgi:exopolysaccharide biosynthesis polyprenyl glycosylphosphotransferase